MLLFFEIRAIFYKLSFVRGMIFVLANYAGNSSHRTQRCDKERYSRHAGLDWDRYKNPFLAVVLHQGVSEAVQREAEIVCINAKNDFVMPVTIYMYLAVPGYNDLCFGQSQP